MRSTVFLIVAMALAGCQSITNTLPPDTTAADVIKDSATLSEVKSLPAPMGKFRFLYMRLETRPGNINLVLGQVRFLLL